MKTALDWPETPLVSTEWLQQYTGADVRIVDASMHMPGANRNASEEFAAEHIPGAVFFDIDEHSSPSELPHMLPDAGQFADAVGAMGISADHRIVVYDSLGLFSAARVWWMFRHFGAAHVYILDGGLPAWKQRGGSLVSSADVQSEAGDKPSACQFIVGTSAQHRQTQVVDAAAVLVASDDPSHIILDARAAARFAGEVKEPRKGLRSGRIPGSFNLPFTQLLNEDSTLKSKAEVQVLLDGLSIDKEQRVITSCGSGVTAAVLCLALERAGYANVALYDGSWTEWGALDQMPVATGS